jgi:uncharacterized protein YuzE
MDFVFSKHAEEQLIRRSLDRNIVESVVLNHEQILEDESDADIIMKVKYNKNLDILYLSFSDEKIYESDEEKKGLILDYPADGKIVGIELLNASQQMSNPVKVEYEFA